MLTESFLFAAGNSFCHAKNPNTIKIKLSAVYTLWSLPNWCKTPGYLLNINGMLTREVVLSESVNAG